MMLNKINLYKRHSSPIFFGVSTALLMAFLFLTSPSEEKFGFSLIVLVLLWSSAYCLCSSIIRYSPFKVREVMIKNIGISISTTVVLAVMFSALGQLSLFDITMLFFLAVIGAFYFARTWPK